MEQIENFMLLTGDEQFAFLGHAFDHVDVAIFVVDENARLIQVNKKACCSLGYAREELLRMRIFDLDPDFSPEQWERERVDIRENRLSAILETRHRTKQGHIFPVEVSVNYICYQGRHYSLAIAHDISERKNAEKQLKLLNYALDHVKEAAWLIDEQAKFHYCNAEACHSIGYSHEEMLNLTVPDIDPDYQWERWFEQWQNVKTQEALTFESRHKAKNGIVFPVEINANYFEFDNRPYVLALVRNISERKAMERELAAREREFRILVENAPAPIFRYDKNCRRIYVNPAVEKMTGKPAAELLNRVPSDCSILSQQEGEKLERVLKQVIETGQVAEGELECAFANGEMHYFYNRYAPELDADNQVISVILVSHDITERKHAERLLQQREQEFYTLVDNLPTPVLRYDRDLHYVYANPAYLQMIGCSESELRTRTIEQNWLATNLSVNAYKAILHKAIRDGEKQEVSLEWINHEGQLVCYALKIVPEYSIGGQIQSILVLGVDFSERGRQHIIENNRQLVYEKMAHNNSLEAILDQVALYVESVKTGRYCAIMLFAEDKKHLQLVAAPSFPSSYCAKNSTMALDIKNKQCQGWVAAAVCNKRVIIKNLYEQSCDLFCLPVIQELGAVASWSEPIISSSNQLLGVVTLYLNQAGEPDEKELAYMLKAAHLSAIAIERHRLEEQMIYQASYDTLTQLPNRRMFYNRLQEEINKAERHSHSVALLFIDLDHFKEVNDTMGHTIGDSLLIKVAQRIRNCIRKSDILARMGGDEFMVILPALSKIPHLERIAADIITAIMQPFKLKEYHTYISASIGIAVYPQDANNLESLVGCVDQAVYGVKKAGRNHFSFFKHSMQEQAQQRVHLINSLREALEKNQFEVYYQPIIETTSGKVVKAEALLRWHHPALGAVSPAVFIPLAEETDLIQAIGSWVFCQAADMAKRWNTLSGENKQRKVSINMSPRQLIRGNADQIVVEHLQMIELDPDYIVIEITEGLLLDDSPHITEKLTRLREAGVELSLDDFGTGYSAMAYLKKFDLNYLKIDRSFVRELETNPDDLAITKAIVVMAHSLGLKVVAEGVETEGQCTLLAEIGCEYMQGYFYAKPMPLDAFLSYVL